MKTYKEFRPSRWDATGLGLPDKQDWLVLPCGRNRDSECLDESNFHVALKSIGGESDTVEVHRFGHWACGWFEVIIVQPNTPAAKVSEEIECALSDYPILDENDLSEREHEAANETWKVCMSNNDRVKYIRENRSQFEFRSLRDVMSCVKGKHFAGYASELLGQ